jgi:hypothetical protein
MARARPTLPTGHGELLVTPPAEEWADTALSNAADAAAWEFEVAGRSVRDLRHMARAEALARGAAFSARLGVPVREPLGPESPIVVTGHQPELYHPGVWVKAFLLERVAGQAAASAIDLVVDSDSFESVSMHAPCLKPCVQRCTEVLAAGGPETCFACAPVPSASEIADFCRAGDGALATLRSPAIRRHFSAFCELLAESAGDARNLAELVTFARRRYEAPANTGYLELPVSSLAESEAFAAFVVDLAANAERFVAAYNGELDEYRAVTKTRSTAQPFPNLETKDGRVELPLWSLAERHRATVWVEPGADGGFVLLADGVPVVSAPAEPEAAIRALLSAGCALAPKALSLTLFCRVFVADLFIHGVGGARYDRVTDGVIRRFYGVEPPAFAVASLTMYLPLGVHLVTEEELAEATERVNRFEHNPDSLLDQVDFDAAGERVAAVTLGEEKAALVTAIAAPDADRKVLGARIRAINGELRNLLAPYGEELRSVLERLKAEQSVAEVLTDRTYPFCFWSAEEVADKVR